MKTTRNRRRPLSVECLILAMLLFGAACSQVDQPDDQTAGGDSRSPALDSLVITLIGTDSMSILDQLLADHEVEAKKTALGSFVISIDGITNGGGCYWLYSINGTMAQEASDLVFISVSDTIRWHFRRFED